MLINEDIREKEIRLIGGSGEQLGIMSSKDAQLLANKLNLDLVKIAPQSQPPVCKIMDYGKFKFEQSKREKEARKNQKTASIKEVRLSPSIDEHDYITKLNHAIRFLDDGDKVKVTIRFRGREVNHAKMGESLLKRFAEDVAEKGNVEKSPKLDGKLMVMFVSPKS